MNSFSIQILDRQINCTIPEEVFLRNVFDMHPLVDAPDASIIIEECPGPLEACAADKSGIIEIKISGEEAFNMNVFRSCVGYLVHKLTPAVFLHGCGIYSIVKKKGILIWVMKEAAKQYCLSISLHHILLMTTRCS